MDSFANRLDLLRRPGETKREFADRIGVSPVQLSRYYSGSSPGRKVLERISRRTGASMDWLLYGSKGEKKVVPNRIGSRITKSLSDEDLLHLAFSYLDDMQNINREGREAIKEILKGVVEDPEHREKINSYYGFIKFRDNSKKKDSD